MKIPDSLFTRRRFLGALFGGWLAALAGAVLGPLRKFIIPPYREPDEVTLPLADFASLAAGQVKPFSWGIKPAFLRKTPDGAYLDTEAELHEYCFAVAGCVGVMLTRLFAARVPVRDPEAEAGLLTLAPVVGEALQLTNIILDWPVDVRRGRCFVPASWLAEHALAPRDLVGRDHPGVRVLAERLESRARAALARVPEYLALVPLAAVRYRLFCLWPAVWAAASLTHARRDPEFPWGAGRPRLPRGALWGRAIGSLFVPPEAALRRA